MSLHGSKRLDGIWHVMAEEIVCFMEHDGPKRLNGVWHVMAWRDWMECGTYCPIETGWSVARMGLESLEGVWHIRA
jgi:hypothetical protein